MPPACLGASCVAVRTRVLHHQQLGLFQGAVAVIALLFSSIFSSEVPKFFFFFHTHLLCSFGTSRGHRCRPFSPPGSCLQFLSRIGFSNPTACRFFIECCLLALSASQFVHKKNSPRIYTSIHSGGFELTKLTYTRLEDKLIRHRGDRRRGIRAADTSELRRQNKRIQAAETYETIWLRLQQSSKLIRPKTPN